MVKCSREFEATNKDFRLMNCIVEGMKSVMNPVQESMMDLILFLAVILQLEREYAEEIIEKTAFQAVLKEFVDRNRNDEKMIEKISQSIACLPLEEFKTLILL